MSAEPNQHSAVSEPPAIAAGRHGWSHLRLWLVAAGGLAVDLWTKQWAVAHLDMHRPRPVFDGVLSLRLSLNPGALFGLGAGMAPLFVGASVLALLFVVYLFWQSTHRHRLLHLALGCVLGGAAGNLYDRTFVTAYVVDDDAGRRDVCAYIREGRTPDEVVVGDFGTRANPRVWDKRHVRAETQPVVRDFLSVDMAVGRYRVWPWVFNVADALLVVGVAALLLNFWTDRRAHRSAEAVCTTEPNA